MEMVINISRQDYVYIAKKHCLPSCDDKTLRKIFYDMIVNGTPLPEGHGRLIDADELELDYDWSEYETDTGQLIVNGYQAYSSTQVESAPIIIEADREDK